MGRLGLVDTRILRARSVYARSSIYSLGVTRGNCSGSWSLKSRRSFATTRTLGFPRKSSQDKDSIGTEAMEYSLSGGDGEASSAGGGAGGEKEGEGNGGKDIAFDGDITRPEREKHEDEKGGGSGSGSGNGSLEFSPANKEFSKGGAGKGMGMGVQEGGEGKVGESAEKGVGKKRGTGFGGK